MSAACVGNSANGCPPLHLAPNLLLRLGAVAETVRGCGILRLGFGTLIVALVSVGSTLSGLLLRAASSRLRRGPRQGRPPLTSVRAVSGGPARALLAMGILMGALPGAHADGEELSTPSSHHRTHNKLSARFHVHPARPLLSPRPLGLSALPPANPKTSVLVALPSARGASDDGMRARCDLPFLNVHRLVREWFRKGLRRHLR